jgi:hypothetical protein
MRKTWLGLLAWCAFASYDPAIFNSLTWRGIGPPRGSRSILVAGVLEFTGSPTETKAFHGGEILAT